MENKEVKVRKTFKCNWCNKRKLLSNGYFVGIDLDRKKWFICDKCNLIKDIV
jgi:transcription elongation factor Elf1